MNKLAIFLVLTALTFQGILFGEEKHCTKCEILREYHKNNPSKYTYYDDYLKDLEEKGAEAVNPSPEDLPPKVRFIMEANDRDTEQEK